MSIVHLCIARIFVISLVISNSKAYILKLSSFAPLSPYLKLLSNYSATNIKIGRVPILQSFLVFPVVPSCATRSWNKLLSSRGWQNCTSKRKTTSTGIEEKRHYYNTLTQSDKWNRMLYCRVKTGENNKIIILRRNPAQIGTGNADASYCKRCERARVLGMDQRLRKGGEDKTLREDYERVNAISFRDFVFLSDQKSNSER